MQNNFTPQTESRKVMQSDFVVPNVTIKIQKCEQPGKKLSRKGNFIAKKKSIQDKIIEL